MAKNLKDIVDEGFTRLSEIGEKRKEILARSESISKATAKQSEEFEQKLSELEKAYLAEISGQVGQLLEELRQTIVQVTENKDLFQGGIKEGLKLEFASILRNADQSQQRMLSAASEKLDSTFARVEKKFAAEKMDFNHEAEGILIDLEKLCRKNRTEINQLHSESTGKLSQAKNEHKNAFGETLTSIVKSAESSRIKASKTVDGLFDEQADALAKVTKKMDSKVSKAVNATLDSLKDACKQKEGELESSADAALNSSAEELKSLSKDSLTELEDSCEFSRNELIEKVTELKEFSQKQLDLIEKLISEKEETARNNASALSTELTAASNAALGGGLSAVDEAFKDLKTELDELVTDLQRKLKDLLNTFDEGVQKLGQGSEKSFADVFGNYKSQLTDMIKVQDQRCTQKEDDLHSYLAKLEKQINETSAGGKK